MISISFVFSRIYKVFNLRENARKNAFLLHFVVDGFGVCVPCSIDLMISTLALTSYALSYNTIHIFSIFAVLIFFFLLLRRCWSILYIYHRDGFLLSLLSNFSHLIRVHSYSPLLLLLGYLDIWYCERSRFSCKEHIHMERIRVATESNTFRTATKRWRGKRRRRRRTKNATANSILNVYSVYFKLILFI